MSLCLSTEQTNTENSIIDVEHVLVVEHVLMRVHPEHSMVPFEYPTQQPKTEKLLMK